MADASTTTQAPLLKVVNADATPEEIAALVAVFSALGRRARTPRSARGPRGATRPAAVRRPTAHGVGAWRASGLPR